MILQNKEPRRKKWGNIVLIISQSAEALLFILHRSWLLEKPLGFGVLKTGQKAVIAQYRNKNEIFTLTCSYSILSA